MFCRERFHPASTVVFLVVLLLFASSSYAQVGTISGKIVDAGGAPLPFTNVMVLGTTIGAMALADVKFPKR